MSTHFKRTSNSTDRHIVRKIGVPVAAAALVAASVACTSAEASQDASHDASASGVAASAGTEAKTTQLDFTWGDGTPVRATNLDADDAAKAAVGEPQTGTTDLGTTIGAVGEETPLVDRGGNPYTVDANGKHHPYFAGKPVDNDGAEYKVFGSYVISSIGISHDKIRFFEGPEAKPRTLTLKDVDRFENILLTDDRVYWSQTDEKTKTSRVVSQPLSGEGKLRVEANNATKPFVTTDDIGVVSMTGKGKTDRAERTRITGLKTVSGDTLLKAKKAWPTNSEGFQLLPVAEGTTLVIPGVDSDDKPSEIILDLDDKQAWTMNRDDDTGLLDDSGSPKHMYSVAYYQAAWAVMNEQGENPRILTFDTRTEKLRQIPLKDVPSAPISQDGWDLTYEVTSSTDGKGDFVTGIAAPFQSGN
ncbi:MAG: hypothetical protein ACTH9H_03980 [Galactobacter sp.]